MIYLTDPTLVHEFLLKDHLVCKKHELHRKKIHYHEAFPFKFGPEAELARNRFLQVFRRDSVDKVMGDFRKVVKAHFESMETKAKEANSEVPNSFVINWRSGTRGFLHTITNTIFFGLSDKLVTVESQNNKVYVEAVLEYLEGPYLDTLNNHLNTMLYKLPEKLNLLKSGKAAQQMRSVLVSI